MARPSSRPTPATADRRRRTVVARHRRPVNVRDDGLPAVLGPLITAGGIELAVLLEVDSGMVLDAWAQGGEAAPSDAEALGARHADVVRALLALAGSPPAEIALTVDGRHHLVRCVADPAGGRLALAVVVNGTPWVVRRVRRHLRQLPDAGLTTGPWILSWAFGPAPGPVAERSSTEPAITPFDELSTMPNGHLSTSPADPALNAVAAGPLLSTTSTASADPVSLVGAADAVGPFPARQAVSVGDTANGATVASQAAGDDGPITASDGGPAAPAGLAAVDGSVVPASATGAAEAAPTAGSSSSASIADPAAAVPDPRRGPAPPSALPPARGAGW